MKVKGLYFRLHPCSVNFNWHQFQFPPLPESTFCTDSNFSIHYTLTSADCTRLQLNTHTHTRYAPSPCELLQVLVTLVHRNVGHLHRTTATIHYNYGQRGLPSILMKVTFKCPLLSSRYTTTSFNQKAEGGRTICCRNTETHCSKTQ